MDDHQFEFFMKVVKDYVDHKQPSQETIRMVGDIGKKLDEVVKTVKQDDERSNDKIADQFAKVHDKLDQINLANFYTKDQADERFASKSVEKNMNKFVWLVVSSVVLALLALVIAPT